MAEKQVFSCCSRGGGGGKRGGAQHQYSQVPGQEPEIIATDPNMQDKEELEFGLDNQFEDDDFQLPGGAPPGGGGGGAGGARGGSVNAP
jgi:hypothetical protein